MRETSASIKLINVYYLIFDLLAVYYAELIKTFVFISSAFICSRNILR